MKSQNSSKSVFLYILFLLFLCNCGVQKSNSEYLQGKWFEVSKKLVQDSIIKDGYETGMTIIFSNDSTFMISFFSGEPIADTGTFSINKDFLILSNDQYPLIELNDSLLIYELPPTITNSYYIEEFKKIR